MIMDTITNLIDLFLHLDKYLTVITGQYGTYTYIILFLIVFAETGLVFTPFLPGDSLLFSAGTIAALGTLNVHLVALILFLAALTGDNVNYFVGRLVGEKLFKKNSRFLKKEYLDKTHSFYEKYGGKTIIIARFVPIVRTFTPFVAGLGKMSYPKYITYCIAGAMLWVGLFVYTGYFFGNLPFIKSNFSFVVIAIILISLLPGIIEFIRHRREIKRETI